MKTKRCSIQHKLKLFVYGTLKKGYANHYLLDNSAFLGNGQTKEKYALYAAGIPFVVKGENVSFIYGEVYDVSKETLWRIDQLEGHPNWYSREVVPIEMSTGSEGTYTVYAWLYFFPRAKGFLVSNGKY